MYDETLADAPSPKIFRDIEEILKGLSDLEAKMSPILAANQDAGNATPKDPDITELDGRIAVLLQRVRSLSARVKI